MSLHRFTTFRRGDSKRPASVQIVPRDRHPISRKSFSPAALKVLYRLHQAGFEAYLVGGAIRDLLAGIPPKDFDVATNASPQQVRRLFNSSYLVGRRFCLVHVRFKEETIEVATFRKASTSQLKTLKRDNEFGTLEEDEQRRDFTVNALYYNISDFSLRDALGGLKDLKDKVIRTIGIPENRYIEDPVRMLRAIRLASKLDFQLEPSTRQAMPKAAPLLRLVSPTRLTEELIKLFLSPQAARNLQALREQRLMPFLLPCLEARIPLPNASREGASEPQDAVALMAEWLGKEAEKRLTQQQSLSSSFLFSALLWYPAQRFLLQAGGYPSEEQLAEWLQGPMVSGVMLSKLMVKKILGLWAFQGFWAGGQSRSLDWIGKPHSPHYISCYRGGLHLLRARAEIEGSSELLQQHALASQEAPPPMSRSDLSPRKRGRKKGASTPRRNKPLHALEPPLNQPIA